VARACKAAGATVLPTSISLNRATEVGATIAVGALKAIVKTDGEDGLVRVLRVLVAAKRGPMKAGEITAAGLVLRSFNPDSGMDDALSAVISSKTAESWAAIAATAVAESGVTSTDATASAWLRALNVRAPVKEKSRFDKPEAESVKREPEPVKPPPRPAPSVPPRAASPAKPAAPSPVSASAPARPPPQVKQAPQDAVGETIVRNGVTLWPGGRLVHRGAEVRLGPEEANFVTMLLRVMPAILGGDRIAAKVYPGRSAGQDLLRGLLPDLQATLARARLTIKVVTKIGYTLFDLGPT